MTTRRWDRSKPPTGPFTLNKDCFQAQGLVCWYPMGGGGVYVPDQAGSNHQTATDVIRTLTNTGAPAGIFSGTTSILQSAVVPVYAAPLAISMWVYKTTAADTTTFGLSSFGDYTLGSAGGARRFQFDTYNGDLRWLSVGASTGVASKSGIVSKRWHHMLGTEESTASRYAVLDGVAGAENTTSATPGGTQNRFVLGAYFDNGANLGFLDGRIGEVCVWSKGQYANRVALADPAIRFELWYPLRSKKWFTAGAGGITGTLSSTLADVTLASTGTLALAGTLSKTLDNATLSATGTLPITATASATLAALTSSATGTLALTGTLTATLEDVALVATGALQATGSGDLAQTLADATLSATGTLALAGVLSKTLDNATLSATGALPIVGTLSKTLDNVTLEAAGTAQTVTVGTLTATLADVTASATGTALIAGSASITLGDCTIVATATMPLAEISGVAAPTLGDLTSAATGTLAIAGVVGATLANCTLVAAGADPSTDTNSAWWTYTVEADNLTFTVAADDLTYTIGV